MALSRVVSEMFNVGRDLDIWVRGHSMSLKVVPFGRSCMVSYQYSDLETRVRGHSRSSKMIPFNPAPRTSY